MKNKSPIDKGTIIIIFLALSLILIGTGLFMLNSHIMSSMGISRTSPKKKIDIEKKEAELKEKYNIEYKSNEFDGYISFVYKENGQYNSIIINIYTGEELNFTSIIKNAKIEEYKKKEEELLKLKYPEFITSAIIDQASKNYYVKDDEVIIYYSNYNLAYNYEEAITLKIDYNEIKNYLVMKPNLKETYQNENGYLYSKEKKAVAITFDDGPSRYYNPLILEELAKNKAHASFFMVGQMMNSCQSCILQTYKTGNEIGSHTYEHMNIKTNKYEKIVDSLNKTDQIYNSVTGEHIKLLRPPYGSYNKNNLETINNAFILWDLDTEDWRYRNVEHIVNYIKENVHDGAIILMHELYESSYQSLKIILPWLYAEGYQVVSVTELAELKNRTLEPGKAYLSLR